MEELKSLLPESQGLSYPQSDYLSDKEKEMAVAFAKGRAVEHFIFKLKQKGVHPETINQKVMEIDWDARINAAEVIAQANQRKGWQIEADRAAKIKKMDEDKEREEIIKIWGANRFYNVIKSYFTTHFGKFIYDSTNEYYIKSVCFFFSRDMRFETELGYSFNKGLLVAGSAGLGKTKTIEAISFNPVHPVRIYSLIDISRHVKEHGSAELDTRNTILLDDVGSEQEIVNHFGTKINWFKEFIESYYLKHKDFSRLIITTNCGGDELENKYGYRVRSRIREMFNVIQVTGGDKR